MDLAPLPVSTFPFEDQHCGAIQECLSFIPLTNTRIQFPFVIHFYMSILVVCSVASSPENVLGGYM